MDSNKIAKFITDAWLIRPDTHREMLAQIKAGTFDPSEMFWYGIQEENGVLLIQIRGVIGGWFADQSELCEVFEKALFQSSAHTVVLRIDSPGGRATGTHEVAEMVSALATRKRVIAFVDDMAASAAYYIAAGANEIYAKPTAIVGSIGCYHALMDDSEAWERAGLKLEAFATSEGKLRAHPGRPFTDADRAFFQAHVNECGERFQAWVSANRPTVNPEVYASADYGDAMSFGLQNGLVDGTYLTVSQMLADVL